MYTCICFDTNIGLEQEGADLGRESLAVVGLNKVCFGQAAPLRVAFSIRRRPYETIGNLDDVPSTEYVC